MQTPRSGYVDFSGTLEDVKGVQPDIEERRWMCQWLCCCIWCTRLYRFFVSLQREVMRHLQFIALKCPLLGRFLIHFAERGRCCKLCGCCWLGFVMFLSVFMALWSAIMAGLMPGDPLDNAAVFKVVEELSEGNRTFSKVCLFKDWTYFVGSELGKVLNHQGIVLEIVNASGRPQDFLQLEYGARGIYWQLSTKPQPDPRYGIVSLDKVGSIPCRYKCGNVSSSQTNPKRLLWFLKKYRYQAYNVFRYNCLSFSEMVYQFHLPGDEQCFTTAQMQERMDAVTRLVR